MVRIANIIFILILSINLSYSQKQFIFREGTTEGVVSESNLQPLWSNITGKPSATNQIWYGAGLQSANLTFDGTSLTSATYLTAGLGGTLGYTRMVTGTALNSGYIEFIRPNAQRAGYLGYADNTGAIRYVAENGAYHAFIGGVIDAGGNKIIGGAAATGATDYVIKSQLDAVSSNISGNGNYVPKFNALGTGIINSRISDNGTAIDFNSYANTFPANFNISDVANYSHFGTLYSSLYSFHGRGVKAANGTNGYVKSVSSTVGVDLIQIGDGIKFYSETANSQTAGSTYILPNPIMTLSTTGASITGVINATGQITGNILASNSLVRATSYLDNYHSSTEGYSKLTTGNSTNSGYVEFYTPDQNRVAYIGFGATGAPLGFTSSNGQGFVFNGGNVSLNTYKIIGLGAGTSTGQAINYDQFISHSATYLTSGIIPDARLSSTISQQSGNWGQLDPHGTFSDFNVVTRIGASFVAGSTNAPSWMGGTQGYQQISSLGIGYPWAGSTAGDYAQQTVIGRNSTTPYYSVRWKEGGVWGAWKKIWSGNSDLLEGQNGAYYLALGNATGTLADARLSVNVPLKNTANTFSQTQTFSSDIISNSQIVSSISADIGGRISIQNPSKTGDIAHNWIIYNMGGGYGNGLNFWSYNQSGVAGTGGQGRTFTIGDDGTITAPRGRVYAYGFNSTVATGTAPLVVASTTLVSNLNADLLDGQQGSYYQNATNINAGTLADGRLSTNIPLLNAATNTFTGNIIANNLSSTANTTVGLDLVLSRTGTTPALQFNTGIRLYEIGSAKTTQLGVDANNYLTVNTGLRLTSSSMPFVIFDGNGVAAPAFTTRSTGTKIVLYPSVSGTTVDYAFGIESGTMWSSVPATTSSFKWYGATTLAATLTGAGAFTTTGTITGANLVSTGSVSATGNIQGSYLTSTVTGAAPLVVASQTVVTNLNSDLLDGYNANQLSLYLGDGTLSGNRTVGLAGNTLTFNNSSTSANSTIYLTNSNTGRSAQLILTGQSNVGALTVSPTNISLAVGGNSTVLTSTVTQTALNASPYSSYSTTIGSGTGGAYVTGLLDVGGTLSALGSAVFSGSVSMSAIAGSSTNTSVLSVNAGDVNVQAVKDLPISATISYTVPSGTSGSPARLTGTLVMQNYYIAIMKVSLLQAAISSADVNISITNVKNGGYYTIIYSGASGQNIVYPSNYLKADGSALGTVPITTQFIHTFVYDGSSFYKIN